MYVGYVQAVNGAIPETVEEYESLPSVINPVAWCAIGG
jgi:hypothetical protein